MTTISKVNIFFSTQRKKTKRNEKKELQIEFATLYDTLKNQLGRGRKLRLTLPQEQRRIEITIVSLTLPGAV